jgi:hypothetical protein
MHLDPFTYVRNNMCIEPSTESYVGFSLAPGARIPHFVFSPVGVPFAFAARLSIDL